MLAGQNGSANTSSITAHFHSLTLCSQQNVKQAAAILLISLGVYSFAFGLYMGIRSVESQRIERLRTIVYPEGPPPTVIKKAPYTQYPIGFFLLSATGTTFGLWSGIHLLWRDKKSQKKDKKKKR